MSLFKKILIALIVLVTIIIVGSLLIKRKQIYDLKHQLESKHMTEGLTQNSPIYKSVKQEIDRVSIDKKKYPNNFNNLSSDFTSYPLDNFMIKSSYNSAYSGGYISDEMVSYVLSRGCRMLDFELFYLTVGGNANAFVGFNPTNETVPQVSNPPENIPTFYHILQQTMGYAFKNSGNFSVTNTGDPLFIRLRVKVDPKNEVELWKKIMQNIAALKKDPIYEDFIYQGQQVTMNTPMKYLMGKTVFIIDNTTTVRNLMEDDHLEPSLFLMVGDTTDKAFQLMNETQIDKPDHPPVSVDSDKVKVDRMRMVAPSNSGIKSNLDIYKMIQNVGSHFSMMMYYYADKQLLLTEDIFATYKGGILPMTYGLQYIQKYPVIQDMKI